MAGRRIATVDTRVLMRRAPARYVAHHRDGTWFVGARAFTDRGPRGFRVTTTGELLRKDPTLRALLRLGRGWAAWRARTGTEWTRARLPCGDVHLLQYDVRPSGRAGRGTGAIVSAWVRRRSLAEARRVARAGVRRAGYRIVSASAAQRLSLAECLPAGRKFHRQAQVDGEALVFHEYPTRRPRRGQRR